MQWIAAAAAAATATEASKSNWASHGVRMDAGS